MFFPIDVTQWWVKYLSAFAYAQSDSAQELSKLISRNWAAMCWVPDNLFMMFAFSGKQPVTIEKDGNLYTIVRPVERPIPRAPRRSRSQLIPLRLVRA